MDCSGNEQDPLVSTEVRSTDNAMNIHSITTDVLPKQSEVCVLYQLMIYT